MCIEWVVRFSEWPVDVAALPVQSLKVEKKVSAILFFTVGSKFMRPSLQSWHLGALLCGGKKKNASGVAPTSQYSIVLTVHIC